MQEIAARPQSLYLQVEGHLARIGCVVDYFLGALIPCILDMAVIQSSEANYTALMRDQINVLTIAEGFFQSSVLFALLNLRIFERIGEDSKTAAELGVELGSRPDTLARLLNAGVVFKLLEIRDGSHYTLTPLSRAVLLPTAGENYLGDWIRNLEYFRAALANLDEAVLKSRPTVDPAAHLGGDEHQTRNFILAMHNYAALRGKELARYLDLRQSETLLDLGCGPGTYAFQLAMRNPHLKIVLLDLPRVLEVAREVQQRYPLTNEIQYLPADALRDEIPGTYDVVLVSNTLHMLGEDASRKLIQKLHASVQPGGSIVIQAQYLRDDRRGNRWPVLMDLLQLCLTPAGKNHSVSETKQWLEDAGFSNPQFCSMTVFNTNSYLRAYKK